MPAVVLVPVLLGFTLQLAHAKPTLKARIQRGKYLVTHVAMCGDCHSPRDAKGKFIRSAWLQGGPLSFKPLHPMPFASAAPAIAGLPMFKLDQQAVTFFETGTNNLSHLELPPMPQYRFNHEDALAVTAYLRSLKK